MPETLPFRDMEGEDLATTVLTCEGDIRDPTFPSKLQLLVDKLQNLISDEENPIKVTKVEPWNSVRVTFNIPLEAAQRLRQLAERGDRVLRELGILSVQIEGDQVITLTLASQYSEPQEIVLRKTSDEQGDVASLSFNLSNSEPGPSTAEPAHKSISQFLGHIVGGASSATTALSSAALLEKTSSPQPESTIGFRSPNVIAPSSSEPIPFPPVSIVTTTTAVLPNPSRVLPNVSLKSPAGFGPFPFASMTHAMNTKNSATSPQYPSVLQVPSGGSRISFTSSAVQVTNAMFSSTSVAASTPSVVASKLTSALKVPRTLSNSAFNNLISRTPPPNAIATSRANVALSSPLLVNLLQSESSNLQPNNKLMPPPTPTPNQVIKKKRKPKKLKDKTSDDVLSPSLSTSPSPPSYQIHPGSRSPSGFEPHNPLVHSINAPLTNSPISSSSSQINIHSLAQSHPSHSNNKSSQNQNVQLQTQGLLPVSHQSHVQGQPMVTTSRPLSHQALSNFRQSGGPHGVPNIHPQAQGQPQVHTGNLPFHTHVPVGASLIPRTSTGSMQSYAMSAPRTVPLNPTRPLYAPMRVSEKPGKDGLLKSDKASTPSTPSTSTPDSNPFPSPPSSSDGKTKHLINPFTGQLEPMPSDEEEEEESIGSLPPFPDFEADTSEKSHSERSLSDGGKDNNHSSDTDSGISKSITDVSQSSSDGLIADSGRDGKKCDASRLDMKPTASVTSSVPGEKIKLRLKIDSKTIRESKESENKEKRSKDCSLPFNQKIDVAVVNIPGLKKNMSMSPSSIPEPRVPPLHISLRGPNSAVVVSPRKDDSKPRYALSKDDPSNLDASLKSQKKIRSPRTSRAIDMAGLALAATGKMVDSIDKKLKGGIKDFKKAKEDVWNQNVKNMSGGGIVEMSDKMSSGRISSFESYLSTDSSSNPGAQHKNSSVFDFVSQDTCKAEVMTLTSCSTGESVTLHTVAGSKSLPLQVASISETEDADKSPSVKSESFLIKSHVALPNNETTSEATDKTVGVSLKAQKEDAFSISRKSPLLQNYLPHSPSASIVNDNSQQQTSNQTSLQSASSVNVEPIVPLSSNSASSTVCTVTSTVQTHLSDSTDANKLPAPTRTMANPLGVVSSSSDSQKLQNNHQCNTTHSSTTVSATESVNIISDTVCDHHEPVQTADNADKVQTHVKETGIASCTERTESVKSQSSLSTLNLPSIIENNDDKSLTNHVESCDSFITVPKKEISQVSENSVCAVNKSLLAPIINVENIPIHTHVIEVPSEVSSPAVPNILANKGRVPEISSVSALIPSSGNAFMPVQNALVTEEETNNNITLCGDNRLFPDTTSLANTITLVTHQASTLPSQLKLLNHVDTTTMQETPKSAKGPPSNSSTNVSEESSMDSIDEERKRLLSEVPSSTPGPPATNTLPEDNPKPSTGQSEAAVKSDLESLAEVKEVKSILLKDPSSCSKAVLDGNPIPVAAVLLKDSTNSHTTELIHSSISSNNRIKENNIDANILCSSESVIPKSCEISVSKEAEANISLLTSSNSTSSLFVMQDIVPAMGLESKITSTKLEVKKESCSDSVHLVSTASNPVVTSLLSPVKYLPSEVSSQKFKLIFKGGGQRTLQSSNSSANLVVPLNSSKTVPIKLVTLPGGGSALSVRSTSNPNIVEIIGPKAAASQNVPSSSNTHPSSPVRLVVSKVSQGLTCSTQGGTQNIINRVLVKSVMMSSTSPSVKVVSTSTVSSTASNSKVPITSFSLQSVTSPSVSVSKSLLTSKPVVTLENAPIQSTLVSCPSQTILIPETNANKSNTDGSTKIMPSIPSSVTIRCSASADSTTKDVQSSDSEAKVVSCSVPTNMSLTQTTSLNCSNSPDSSTSIPLNSSTPISGITLHDTTARPSSSNTLHASANCSPNLTNSSENVSKSEVADASKNSSDVSSVTPAITNESSHTANISSTVHPNSIKENTMQTLADGCNSNKCASKEEVSVNSIVESSDSIKSEQTTDSAITTNLRNISNKFESPETADSSSSVHPPPVCSDSAVTEESKTICNSHSDRETDKAEDVVSGSDISQNRELDSSDTIQSEHAQNELHKDTSLPNDIASNRETNEAQKFRPLGDEDGSEEVTVDSSLVSKTLKRKCSENAAGLIKACMGMDDAPKKAALLVKAKVPEEIMDSEKVVEENVRMSLRVRKDENQANLKKTSKGPSVNSDCSTDEEITLSELKSRPRDKASRGRVREINCLRQSRRRSGSNESRNSEDIKTRPKNKKTEPPKTLRTKRGTITKAQDQVISKMGLQRSTRIRDQEAKASMLNNNKEENSIVAKRKTRATAEAQEVLVQVKRRRYSKDGHR